MGRRDRVNGQGFEHIPVPVPEAAMVNASGGYLLVSFMVVVAEDYEDSGRFHLGNLEIGPATEEEYRSSFDRIRSEIHRSILGEPRDI